MAYTRLASSQWVNNQYCDSPADVLYVFDMIDVMAFYPAENETWPAIVTMAGGTPSPIYGDYACGNLRVFPMDGDCCLSSMSKGYAVGSFAGSGEYASGIVNYDFGLQSFTRESNGHMYCSLNATTRLEPSPIDGNLFGWARIYYLAQSPKGIGVCIDDSVKCFDNGTLFVYPDLQCQGVPTAVQLSDAIQPFEDDILGSVTGQMITPTTGDTHVFWITMQPPSYFRSNISGGFWQALEVFNFTISMSGYLYLTWLAIDSLRSRRTTTKLLLLVRTVLAVLETTNLIGRIYIVIGSQELAEFFFGLYNYLHGTASLVGLWYTWSILCILQDISKGWAYIVTILIFVVHFVLAGEVYFQFLWNTTDESFAGTTLFTHTFLNSWLNLAKYYDIVVHLWNTLPGPLLYYKLAASRTKSHQKALQYIYEQDKTFLLVLGVRIACILGGYIVNYILDHTIFLKSDANAISFSSLVSLLDCYLLLSQVYMLESVRRNMGKASDVNISTFNYYDNQKMSLKPLSGLGDQSHGSNATHAVQ